MMFMMQAILQTKSLSIYLIFILFISLFISGILLVIDILNSNDCRLLYNLIKTQNANQTQNPLPPIHQDFKLVSYQCHHQSLEMIYSSKQNQVLRQTIKLIDANTYPPRYEIQTRLPSSIITKSLKESP